MAPRRLILDRHADYTLIRKIGGSRRVIGVATHNDASGVHAAIMMANGTSYRIDNHNIYAVLSAAEHLMAEQEGKS